MKSAQPVKPAQPTTRKRGSALITVVLIMSMMAVLTGSLLTYTVNEKRGNMRNILQLRAKNMAENISIFAAEQLTTRLLHSKPTVPKPFTGSEALEMPDSSGERNVLGTVNYAVPGSMEVAAGAEAMSALTAITDPTDANFGLYVQTVVLPIIAKATVSHSVNGTFSAYVLQEMKITMAPLFQFGMFYNMDMEFYPSQDFIAAGPVHTNGNLMVHPDYNTTIAIRFTDRVTTYGGYYWKTDMKAKPRGGTGGERLPVEANGNVYFTHTNGTTTANLKGTSGTMTNKWRDHKYGTATETTATVNNFKSNATTVYNGNLRSSAHGVKRLELPGVNGYKEVDDPGTGSDERNNGRQIIEPPNAKKWKNSTSAFEVIVDDNEAQNTKISWRAGLYIMVNPDDDPVPRSGTLPNGTTAYVLPRSYRAWLNTINTGTGAHTLTEVVLPGQPTYGYVDNGAAGASDDDTTYRNYLPNRYVTNSIGGDGTGNQVLRIPRSGYDLARGYTINNAGGYAIDTTDLAVADGSGRYQMGEVVRIGVYSYLVYSHDMATNTLKLMPPGLRVAVADDAIITTDPRSGMKGTNKTTAAASATAGGGTVLTFNDGAATTTPIFYPGNIVFGTASTDRFLVTAAPTPSTVSGNSLAAGNWFVGLGKSGVAIASSVAVTVDATNTNAMGTSQGHLINGALAVGAGNTAALPLDTGTGTIWPGNSLVIASTPYMVVASSNTGASPVIYPGLAAAAADDSLVVLDPFPWAGYSARAIFPDNSANLAASNLTYPDDNGGSGSYYCAPDAFFYDIRRANGNRGVISITGTTAYYARSSVNYVPRPIAKIDFDMTRFKLMFERVMNSATTASIYDVRAPTTTVPNTVTFINSIYKAHATGDGPASFGTGLWNGTAYSLLPVLGGTKTEYTRQDPYRIYYAPATPADAFEADPSTISLVVPTSALYDGTAPDAWYDGTAIYLHSLDAEVRAQTSGVPNRIDSGVRMWNGRGNVPSITDKPGFTFVTNDPVYIVGHFNADGNINSTVTNSSATGGYSARYPDNSTEVLCAVMGDAFTALTHPIWDTAAGGQTDGWNDALSALPRVVSTANWRSMADPITGDHDGVRITGTGPKPGLLPNQNYPRSASTARTTKFAIGVPSEVSAALLMGLVPSNHDATQLSDSPPYAAPSGVNSGGANNFPRLTESWNGVGLYIRGSIVGLFESRVAMEPFTNARNYAAAGRFWGLHETLRDKDHHIPLEPVLIGCNRNTYRELTKAEYDAKKAAILALAP